MASFKDIPFAQVKNVASGFKNTEALRSAYVRIAIVLDGEVPQDLVVALKEALVPKTSRGLINVAKLSSGETLHINPDADLAIVLSGTAGQALAVAHSYAECSVPCAVIVQSAVELSAENLDETTGLICAASPATMLVKLAAWMVSACPAHLALATNFDFVRSQVSDTVIVERAAQNAVIGVLPFGNSADMPVMAANQFLMSLDLAGAHAHGTSKEVAAQGAAIVASSFASRSLARSLMKKAPGLGWAVRGCVGFAATYVLGKAMTMSYVVQDAWKTRQ